MRLSVKPLLGAGIVMVCLTLLAPTCRAGDEGEFYVNTHRELGGVSPLGRRAAAMGGAGRGLADGVSSLGVNPAALGAYRGYGVEAGLGFDWLDDGLDDTTQTSFRLGGAVNLDCWRPGDGPNQAIGGLLHTRNYSGAGELDMKREQTGVLFAYGLHLMDNLLAGVSVAVFDGKWKSAVRYDANGDAIPLRLDRSFTGGDFRLGGIYRFSDETTMGATLNYATGSFRERGGYAAGAGTGSLNRWGLGAGVAHQYAENTLLLGDLWFDQVKTDVPGVLDERSRSWGLGVGVEQLVIPELLALRGGLYYDRVSYSGSGIAGFVPGNGFSKGRFGITAGVGLKLYQFDIGYSLDVNSRGDVKNLLDVAAEW